jgi:hypothetical protein
MSAVDNQDNLGRHPVGKITLCNYPNSGIYQRQPPATDKMTTNVPVIISGCGLIGVTVPTMPDMSYRHIGYREMLEQSAQALYIAAELWGDSCHPPVKGCSGFKPRICDFIESRKHTERPTTVGQELWEEDLIYFLRKGNGFCSSVVHHWNHGPYDMAQTLRLVLDGVWKDSESSKKKAYEKEANTPGVVRHIIN